MFDVVENLRDTAAADAAFGKPQEVEGRVLVPVAAVNVGFGMGFGQGTDVEDEEDEAPSTLDQGGGAGGGARSRPVAVIEVTPEGMVVKPIIDEGKVALAGILLVGWCVLWLMATIRGVFGHKGK
jgi:uncharacterized spore protein YtfJ